MYKIRNDKRGMTLIEMIISLVILSILMTSTVGMITSSSKIFTSTSQAALDKLVGNSVFTTLESATKYATHLRISDTPCNDYAQTFAVKTTDADNKSGSILYRRDNETFIPLYSEDFYGKRSIQYDVKKVGEDNKHIKITVRVVRDGKFVYERTSVIKCVNLGLLKSGVSSNEIDDSATAGDSVNQYLSFSTDELLIAGGDSAYSIEYKIADYMERYNAILREYYTKLGYAVGPLNTLIDENRDEEGKRVQASVLTQMLNDRDKAIFGYTGGPVEWEGNDYLSYCNLRKHYQDEIKDLLKFTPTNSVPTSTEGVENPYYGVTASKEELYTGFLLTYYDKNKDNKVTKDEYPQFSSPNTYFAGTTLSQYADPDTNGMVILGYFNDLLNDNYENLFSTSDTPVASYDSLRAAYDPSNIVYASSNPGLFSGSDSNYKSLSDSALALPGGVKRSFRSCTTPGVSYASYTYNGDGGSVANGNPSLGTYKEKGVGWFAWKANWEKSFNDCVDRIGAKSIESVADLDETGKRTLSGTECSEFKFKAKWDIPEGWYYYVEDSAGFKGAYIFYLEASDVDNTLNVAVEQYRYIYIYSDDWTLRDYYYEQAQFMQSDGPGSTTSPVKKYTIHPHKYEDWMLYSVDWNSWYSAEGSGLLNKVMATIVNFVTDRENITSVSGTNPMQSLGYTGQYTVNETSTKARSYNLAWCVYHKDRCTWYYLPAGSTKISNALTGTWWYSHKDAPVPLDLKAWPSSTAMMGDITNLKLTSSTFFKLVDTTQDKLWVALPVASTIDPDEVLKSLTTTEEATTDPTT